MAIKKQAVLFLLIGCLQYIFDVILFAVFLSFGIPIWLSNFFSRILCATAGYILNGRYTFSKNDNFEQISEKSFFRFFIRWTVGTILSTVAIYSISDLLSHENGIIIAKIVAEFFIVLASFIVDKYWVYDQ